MTPESRIRVLNKNPINKNGQYVLYWMTAFRRVHYNFSLQRAIEHAYQLNVPLVILEALRCEYPWASARFHAFVIEGMRDNASACENKPTLYYPYVEPEPNVGSGMLLRLAQNAAVVVGDDYPSFFLPRMMAAAAQRLEVKLEAVDSNGLLPLYEPPKAYPTAYAFRRYLQKHLPEHLSEFPEPDPFEGANIPVLESLPDEIVAKWQPVAPEDLEDPMSLIAKLPIEHEVEPCAVRGGTNAARAALREFLDEKLPHYAEKRNEPERDVGSGLSPYLHWGHISTHEVFEAICKRESWSPAQLSDETKGKREGWWGMSPEAESFLDELITWREVGYTFCALRDDYGQYDSLPDWAKATLADHADDPREHVYSLEAFESAQTHDPLWNAAQTQLLQEGRIHNYLRMLWGKKIIGWTETPQQALGIMIQLNNKYVLDGRDPNSYSGIFWCFGRFDRPWPEREIFGKVRYMSSQNTARKVNVKGYIKKYAPVEQ